MGRVFFLSSHKCEGESGGGHGVIYRLYLANKKYGLFQRDVIYIFKNGLIEGNEEPDNLIETNDKQSDFRVRIKKYIPSVLRVIKAEKGIKDLEKYLGILDNKYKFCNQDVFVCHDFRIAYAFTRKYGFENVIMVYHMQGSIYFEWHSETGISSSLMHRYYNFVFKYYCNKIKNLCFPSRGTEESLVASEPEIKDIVSKIDRKYLYNGVYCKNSNLEESPDWIKNVSKIGKYKFVTVANLNEAKAVERIPEFLFNLKMNGVEFIWILVGDGVNHNLVQENITKFALEHDVIWVQDKVPHQDLLSLLSITDFYILLHKYSIFDLSTLEAMHYGNIPLLSPVGGNKEMIIEGNGVFVSNGNDVEPFLRMIQEDDLEEKKRLNITLQTKLFNDNAFLQRYVDLCEHL